MTRTVPAIRLRPPVPTLGDFVALLGVSYDAWRLRRINAGLQRALARDDAPAVARWVSRGEKALADMDAAQPLIGARSRFPGISKP